MTSPSPCDANPHEHFSDRLKQSLALLFFLWTLVLAPFCILAIFAIPFFWPLVGLYALWFIYDYKKPLRGARFNEKVLGWTVWKHFSDYFPVRVHKTAEIPPTQNYVFSAHPHGVLGMASVMLFTSCCAGTHKLFPGIKIHGATLGLNFLFPLRREFFMSLGLISADKEAIEYVLSRPEKGNAVGIVPGGAAESLESDPLVHRLIERKGFIRLAIKHGASLVPVYNFGETSLYHHFQTKPGSPARKFQDFVKRSTTFTLPIVYGQNFLASLLPANFLQRLPKILTVGLLPFRERVNTVVGAPIPVEKNEDPSEELVDSVHREYCLKLKELFNRHKVEFGNLPPEAELEFLRNE